MPTYKSCPSNAISTNGTLTSNIFQCLCDPSDSQAAYCPPWLGCYWADPSCLTSSSTVIPPTASVNDPVSNCCTPADGLVTKYIGPVLSVPCTSITDTLVIPPPNSTSCPDNPEECSSGCCCCSSAAYSEMLSTRCYDYVAASCNADGSGPAPGEQFADNCQSCFETCDLLLSDPDGCSKIKDLSWWNLENSPCSCFCKEPIDPSTLLPEGWQITGDNPLTGTFYQYVEKDSRLYALGDFVKDTIRLGAAYKFGTSWEIYFDDLYPVKLGENNLFFAGSDYHILQDYMDSIDPDILEKYDFDGDGIITASDVNLAKGINHVVYDATTMQERARINAVDYVTGNSINSIVAFNGFTYAGGSFSKIYDNRFLNTTVIPQNIFRLDNGVVGFSPGITGVVTAMLVSEVVFPGELIIATSDKVYRMDTAENAVDITPVGNVANIQSICEFEGELIVSGGIISVNGINCNIAGYSASTGLWRSILGSGGMDGAAYVSCVHAGNLYVGGIFTTVNGLICSNIAYYDGISWNTMSGTNGAVYALYSQVNGLRVGGDFTNAGGITVSGEALWVSPESQSTCNLTCAICGKCDAVVSVENVQCKYKFSLQPSDSCCKPNNDGEKVLILWSNYGFMTSEILEWENNALSDFSQRLTNFIAAHDNYSAINIDDASLGLTLYNSNKQAGSLYCLAELGSLECASGNFCVTFNTEECGVNLTTYTNGIFNYLCFENSELLRQFTKINLIILVHGEAAQSQNMSYFTTFFNQNYQLKQLLDNLHVSIHVVTFTNSVI
jgi:hypothetical protein